MKLKKGDTVKILLGKDKNRKGKIQKIYTSKDKILVEGLNIYKKHVKPKGEGQKGGIVEISRPILASKTALICPACAKPTRVGYSIAKNSKKQRICKKCKGLIDG